MTAGEEQSRATLNTATISAYQFFTIHNTRTLYTGSSEAARVLLRAHVDGPAAGGVGFEARCVGALVALRPDSRPTRRARDGEPVASARSDRRAALRAHSAQVHTAARECTRGDQHTRARVGRPKCATALTISYTRNCSTEHHNTFTCTYICVCLQNTQTQFGNYSRSRVFVAIIRHGKNLSLF